MDFLIQSIFCVLKILRFIGSNNTESNNNSISPLMRLLSTLNVRNGTEISYKDSPPPHSYYV